MTDIKKKTMGRAEYASEPSYGDRSFQTGDTLFGTSARKPSKNSVQNKERDYIDAIEELTFSVTDFVPTEAHVCEQYKLAGFKVQDPYEPCRECGAVYQGIRLVDQPDGWHVAEHFTCKHLRIGRRV